MQPLEPGRPETAEEIAKREAAARWEHDRADRTATAMFPMVASFAVEAVKAASLVNGGAAAAMLAFIGTGRQPVTLDTISGLRLFGFGLLSAMLATAATYLAQFFYLRKMQGRIPVWHHPYIENPPASRRAKWAGAGFHVLGFALVVAAYGCAVAGLFLVAGSLIPLPAKA